MKLFCCGCNEDVLPRLTSGQEIYPHRQDLERLPFWICDKCKNYVGCHHKTAKRTAPLGCIPTAEIRKIRSVVHATLDPLWKAKKLSRSQLYARMSERLGKKFHTAEIRSIAEAESVLGFARRLVAEIGRRAS